MPTLDLLRDRLGFDLRELAGARASGEVPISDTLVNRLLGERLSNHPQIAAVRVQAQPDDAIAIELTPRVRMMPTLRIVAQIVGQPEFPDRPTLLLRWSMPMAGPLALLAAPVLGYLKAMPPGIWMDGDRVAIDLQRLLRDRGLGDVLALIRRLELHTRAGGFVASFDLAVS